MNDPSKFVYEGEQALLDQLRKEIGSDRWPAWDYLLKVVTPLSLSIIKDYGGSGDQAIQDAKDLTQTVIMDFYIRLQEDEDRPPEKRFQLYEGKAVKDYLRKCCSNQWAKTSRRAMRAPMTGARADAFLVRGEGIANEEGEDDPFLSIEYKDQVKWLEKIMDCLPPVQRKIIRLHLADTPIPDIQKEMRLASPGTASVTLNRAKNRFRHFLDKVNLFYLDDTN